MSAARRRTRGRRGRSSARIWLVLAGLAALVLAFTLWREREYRDVQETLERLAKVLRVEGIGGTREFLTEDFTLIVDGRQVARPIWDVPATDGTKIHLELRSHTPDRISENGVRLQSTFRLRRIDMVVGGEGSLITRTIGSVASLLTGRQNLEGLLVTEWVTEDGGDTYLLRLADLRHLRGPAGMRAPRDS